MNVLDSIRQALGGTADSRIMVERAISSNTLILNNRSLCTLVRLEGLNSVKGNSAMDEAFETLERMLHAVCTDGSYVQMIFENDPENAAGMIKDKFEPNVKSAKDIGLYHRIFFDEQVKKLATTVSRESVFLCVYTSLFLSDTERKRDQEQLLEMSKSLVGGSRNAQSESLHSKQIVKRHSGNIKNISTYLKDAGVSHNVLKSSDAIVELRKSIEPEMVAADWAPAMGDKSPPLRMYESEDVGQVLFPRVSDQVMTSSLVADDDFPYMFRRGRTYVACTEMSIPPSPDNITPFNNLKARFTDGLPVRISYLIGGDGLRDAGELKGALASMLSILPGGGDNKRIKNAIEALSAVQESTGQSPLSLRCNAVTWAPNKDAAAENVEAVMKGFEGWASPKMDLDFANCFDTFFSTLPCNGLKNEAPCAAAVGSDLVRMLPWNRPSTPWKSGYISLVNDMKLMNFDLGTTIQDSWNINIFAPMGKGKSVFMMMLALSVLFKEGNREIPYVLFLDIGPSSAGLLRLIENILPEDKKQYVLSRKLQFDPSMSINPLDTWTGARRPLPVERGHMLSILTLLVTPANSDETPKYATEVLASCLDEVFDKYGSREDGKRYEQGIDRKVDASLKTLHFKDDSYTLWWDVIDFLFEQGDMDGAGLAQRYAVPLISDIINNLVQSESLRNLYGDYNLIIDGSSSGDMKLLDVLSNSLSAALKDFKIFSRPTTFAINNARIISLDLENVALDPKKTAVMYSVAKQVGARRFYIDAEDSVFFPAIYRDYYRTNAPKWRAIPKALFVDEKHRTRDKNRPDSVIGKIFDNMIKSDERVGRKYEVYIIQASQMAEDFDEESNILATTKFILGTNSALEAIDVGKTFGLTKEQVQILKNKVLRPGQMLMVYKHSTGDDVQFCELVISTKFLYAVTTNAREVLAVKTMESKLGYFSAIDAMEHFFPKAGTFGDKIKDEAGVPDLDDMGAEKVDNLVVEVAGRLADEWLLQQENQGHYHEE